MTCGAFSMPPPPSPTSWTRQYLYAAVVAAVAAIADRGGAVIDRAYKGPQPPTVGVTMSNASAPLRRLAPNRSRRGEQSGGCSKCLLEMHPCPRCAAADEPTVNYQNRGQTDNFFRDVLEIALTPSMVTIYLEKDWIACRSPAWTHVVRGVNILRDDASLGRHLRDRLDASKGTNVMRLDPLVNLERGGRAGDRRPSYGCRLYTHVLRRPPIFMALSPSQTPGLTC